jgi:hypothetical protein
VSDPCFIRGFNPFFISSSSYLQLSWHNIEWMGSCLRNAIQEYVIVLCNYCHGKHLVIVRGCVQPCEECGGMGEIHCCEGLQEQPDGSHPLRPRVSELEETNVPELAGALFSGQAS